MAVVRHKAAIHSGHFMVSDFEPEEQDEEEVDGPADEGRLPQLIVKEDVEAREGREFRPKDDLIVLPPDNVKRRLPGLGKSNGVFRMFGGDIRGGGKEIPLHALFRSLSMAYKQKLTTPKWNRFRGLKLRWKDKIRMNNVIWRCWHMQFMRNEPRRLCAFANPLEIDHHGRTEGGTILEGKYWKRKVETIKKEYLQWRLFYTGNAHGHMPMPNPGGVGTSLDVGGPSDRALIAEMSMSNEIKRPAIEGSQDDSAVPELMDEEGAIVDLLLNTIQLESAGGAAGLLGGIGDELQQFISDFPDGDVAVEFPNMREFYKQSTNADLLQPGLGSLQPNIEDTFDFSWLDINSQQQQQLQHNQMYPPSSGKGGKKISNATAAAGASGSGAIPGAATASTSSSSATDKKMDLISAVVAVTTATVTNNPPTYPNPPRGEPVGGGGGSYNPMSVRSSSTIPSVLPSRPQYQQQPQPSPTGGGGKLRSHIYQQQQQQYAPYPTTSSDKLRSPKHRMMLQQQQDFQGQQQQQPYVQQQQQPRPQQQVSPVARRASAVVAPFKPHPQTILASASPSPSTSSSRSATAIGPPNAVAISKGPNSELVELLQAPKAQIPRQQQQQQQPQYAAFAIPSQRRPPPVASETAARPTDLSRKYASKSTPIPTRAVLSPAIPPPLPSDYQQVQVPPVQHHGGVGGKPRSYRGLTNTPQYAEHRRSVHINAEQNRRTSIKHGFEDLRVLIPCLRDVPASSHKISKAALLHKGGDHIKQIMTERKAMDAEALQLNNEIERLELEIARLHGSLPVIGRGGHRQVVNGMLKEKAVAEDNAALRSMFADHVRCSTAINWKYWVFSRLMKPLFETYSENVAGASTVHEMQRATSHWFEDKFSQTEIRQSAIAALRNVSVSTNILTAPERMPQEALDHASLAEAAAGNGSAIKQEPREPEPDH